MSAEDRVWFFKLGDRLWHSDSSFRPVPAKYSLLSGRVIPSWGANTEFADMRAAYDALDERSKAEVEELVCEHSLIYSREAIGFTDLTPEEMAAFRPVRQPLVRTHPVTGRKSLFLAAHAGTIVGWTIPEARMSANSVLAPQDGMTRPESSEYFAGTGRNELSECHSRSPSMKNHTRSSAAMIRPSLSRFEKSAIPGPSRCSARRRMWPGVE